MTHGERQQCGDGQRESGAGAGRSGAKGKKMGTSAIESTIKIKDENMKETGLPLPDGC